MPPTETDKKMSTKIVLAGKLGLPKVVTTVEPRAMVSIKEDRERAESDSESSGDGDTSTIFSTASTVRNPNETPEEKRARKKKVNSTI